MSTYEVMLSHGLVISLGKNHRPMKMSGERSLGKGSLLGDRLGLAGSGTSLVSGQASGVVLIRRKPSDKSTTADEMGKEQMTA